MELNHTIDGLAYFTMEPEHLKDCQHPGFRKNVNQNSIKWTCKGCGVSVSIDRMKDPEEGMINQ